MDWWDAAVLLVIGVVCVLCMTGLFISQIDVPPDELWDVFSDDEWWRD